MANNRLYIVDETTGATFMLAKCQADGWFVPEYVTGDKLTQWLDGRDMAASYGGVHYPKTELRLLTEGGLKAPEGSVIGFCEPLVEDQP